MNQFNNFTDSSLNKYITIKWLIPVLSFILIISFFGFTFAFYFAWNYFNKNRNNINDTNNNLHQHQSKHNSKKKWSNLNEETTSSSQNYGTYDSNLDKQSNYSYVESIESNNQSKRIYLKNLVTNLFKKGQTKHDCETGNHISSKYSRMSSLNSSISYNSINSLRTILSNENLPLHQQSSMILNYSIYLNRDLNTILINPISLENVKSPPSLTQSNLELNIYIKIELLIPKEHQDKFPKLTAKTRFIKNCSNPIYDETFEFANLKELFILLDSDYLDNNFRLVFNVCNLNLFGRDQIIGQMVHELIKQDFKNSIYSKNVDLVDSSKLNDVNLGQLNLSIMYNDTNKTIRIHLLKAFNLKLPKYFLNSDKKPSSYIKIYMLYRGQRVDKKQTKIVCETNDPVYDEVFEFDVFNLLQLSQPMENINFEMNETKDLNEDKMIKSKISSRIQFVLLVMDFDKVDKNDVIGKIELNTQHHLKKLLSSQIKKNYNDNFTHKGSNPAQQETCLIRPPQQNWFDIFNQPNIPILCNFQIKIY